MPGVLLQQLQFGGVFDRVAMRVQEVGERVVAGQVATRPQTFLAPERITRPDPRMYSSTPRISKETWCSEVCGPLAIARL